MEFVSIWGKVEFENADDNKYNIRKGIIDCNSFFRLKISLQLLLYIRRRKQFN